MFNKQPKSCIDQELTVEIFKSTGESEDNNLIIRLVISQTFLVVPNKSLAPAPRIQTPIPQELEIK